MDTKSSNPFDFYPKHFNHAFIPTPDFEGYRRSTKEQYENATDQLEGNPEFENEDRHQMPDHPNTFMNTIKARAMGGTAANDERRPVLNPRVIWDGSFYHFKVFRNNVEGHYGKTGAGYLFDPDFQAAYIERGTECFIDFLDEVPSASQIKKDTRALYGALLSACQGGNKEKATGQVNSTSQAASVSKKDKVNQVIALVNELQIQDSTCSDDELEILLSSKTAMVCKLAQVPPVIWMTIPLEAKTWLLNERKRQQLEDDKLKKSFNSNIKETTKSSGRDNCNSSSDSNMPNQYAKVKNAVKGEDEIQNQIANPYGFIVDFLADAVKSSNLYVEQDTEYETWNSEHNVYTSISINNTLYNKCLNLLFLPETHHISILDGGADTCVSGKGCDVLSMHNSRRANAVGFDHETAIKKNLPIVSAITAVDLPDGQSILLVINEGIYNETSNHSLLSEFQLREYGVIIDSICHRHGGTQMKITDSTNHDDITIPLDLAGCMIHFRHRLPTNEEFTSLKQFCLTQGDTPRNPSSFCDQVADKFHIQVVDPESYNANSLKLFPYDPSDTHKNRLNGRPARLTFCPNIIMKAQVRSMLPKSLYKL